MGDTLSPQLRVALGPLLSALETITARIREYDAQIEKLAEESYRMNHRATSYSMLCSSRRSCEEAPTLTMRFPDAVIHFPLAVDQYSNWC
jgi:hypothetical protein